MKQPRINLTKISNDTSRTRISQQDVPSMSLTKAVRVARAIGEQYGFKPVTPIQLAKALEMQTTSGPFRAITGASIAYGLTKGGYNADTISLEPLGLKIVRPTIEGDDIAGKRQALIKPRVIRDFLTRYDGAAVPREDIALNVLNDLGVPPDRTKSVFDLIIEGAETVGILQEIKGRKYVDLSGANIAQPSEEIEGDVEIPNDNKNGEGDHPTVSEKLIIQSESAVATGGEKRARRVFITHGKNIAFVEPIKKLLAFGELEPIVAVERQSVSQPVSDKVMSDMRSCGAAIIHVEEELNLIDKDANPHILLNSNVLIEIGAAMALYGRRFILLVKEGIELPSNVKGLYEVRYSGDQLDSTATIKLLEAIRDIKNHPLP